MTCALRTERVSELPEEFLEHLGELETRYLRATDPIRQSGFSGGPDRWRAERAPILTAIHGSGDLLDVGCANGYLLECLVRWAAERGLTLTPYGVDLGARLIELARRRQPRFRDHFFVANACSWQPPRRFSFVYALYDCVPLAQFGAFVAHLRTRVVAPGGRLIVGAYGNRSRGELPPPIDEMLAGLGCVVAGTARAGEPPTARFAWVDSGPE